MGRFLFVEVGYAVYAGDVRSCSFHQTRFSESTERQGCTWHYTKYVESRNSDECSEIGGRMA